MTFHKLYYNHKYILLSSWQSKTLYTWEDWLTSDTFSASKGTLARAQSLSSLLHYRTSLLFLFFYISPSSPSYAHLRYWTTSLNYDGTLCFKNIQNAVSEIELIFSDTRNIDATCKYQKNVFVARNGRRRWYNIISSSVKFQYTARYTTQSLLILWQCIYIEVGGLRTQAGGGEAHEIYYRKRVRGSSLLQIKIRIGNILRGT